jgi:asparagine synthase (glutamine-hydrolysing)
MDPINDAARARKLPVVLTGQMGNMSISYGGETLLPQLIRSGRWLRWLREGSGVVRNRHMRPLGVLNASFGPYVPLPLWTWINKVLEDRSVGLESYSALNPERVAALRLDTLAKERALDLSYRPRKDGFETRLWVLRRLDLGNYHKGILGGWGIDQRDPTTDRRLSNSAFPYRRSSFSRMAKPRPWPAWLRAHGARSHRDARQGASGHRLA